MNARRTVWVLAIFTAVALFTAYLSEAQEARGAITGKVKDPGQAIVANATVKVTNVAMGTTVTAVTNDAGLYQVTYLIPGTYRIEVEASGFKRYVRDKITLRVNDTLEIDVELEIGNVGETITVTGDAPLLDTATASMGQVVDSRRIQELPIGHGDPYALIGLASGVSFTRSQRLDRPFEPTHIVGYTIDGTRANRSDLTIDGAASTATANAGEVISSFVPPQDIVQEFKVQTSTFDASFGNTEGGVTNLSIKSGTNQFHGTAYYTNFTKGTSANDFYANRADQPLADFYYHRFGGTVGGPVWVPKIYKGENKTFFMYGIEGIREARPRNNGTLNIPTEKMRNGDFSDLLAIGPQYQIYNPFTRRAVGNGRFQQDPFPGNIIPQNLINPIARKFVDSFLAKPTSAPTAADGTGNFQQPGLKERAVYYSNTIRIDHVINEKHRIFGRASWYDRDSDYNNYYNNLATGTIFQFISRQGVFDHVFAMNSTTVLNLRYGYNRFIRYSDSNPESFGFDLSSLGFPSSYSNLIDPGIRRFPRFDISGYQGTAGGADFRPNDTHSFVGQLNKVKGTHSLKTGLEFRSYRENSFFNVNSQTGQFVFDNNYTRGPLDNSPAPTQLSK
ncbi:MAG TPA: carboxypeptidase-like regulatory domain-containing protein [Blastocatellia bacterium]|nr:carboxypeptidase-like regulatory domain-containing protein [Blastocatellia bacterium]